MAKDAYTLILEAIEAGVYKPGDRLVESDLADRFGVSRTPVREALQRMETQSMLARDDQTSWPNYMPCALNWKAWPPALPRAMPRMKKCAC